MNEEMNNNEEPKVEVNSTEEVQVTVAPIESAPEQVAVTPEPAEVPAESAEAPVEPVPEPAEPVAPLPPEEPKPKSKALPIIIGAIVLVLIGLGVAFGMGLFGSSENKEANNTANNAENGNKEVASATDKFVGIYASENNKMFIHKESDTLIHYVIGDSFEGSAIVTEDTAKERNGIDDDYFSFKLTDEGIELTYVTSDEDKSVVIDTGLYKKVAEYTKENVYKEAVGDPSYLTSNYSGLFKSGEIELYVYQTSEKEFMVRTTSDVENYFEEKFELESENKLVSKSFFNEDEIAYEIEFNDKSFSFVCHEEVFGVDEEDKQFELTYTFEKALTQDEIIENFYNSY